jgi:hypothetical protein
MKKFLLQLLIITPPAATGVYFYRIEAKSLSNSSQSFIQVKKMLVIK